MSLLRPDYALQWLPTTSLQNIVGSHFEKEKGHVREYDNATNDFNADFNATFFDVGILLTRYDHNQITKKELKIFVCSSTVPLFED